MDLSRAALQIPALDCRNHASELYHHTADWGEMGTSRESTDRGDCSITEEVLEEVAEAEGAGPLELPPLYDTVDADALESLLSGTATDDRPEAVEVTFQYCGYAVSVDSDGTARIVSE